MHRPMSGSDNSQSARLVNIVHEQEAPEDTSGEAPEERLEF